MFGRFQMWINGSGQNDRQFVILVRGDQNMRLEDSQNISGTERMRDFKRNNITLCGSQKGEHFVGRGDSRSGSTRVQETVEGVTTTIGDSKYAAMYIRPTAMRPDPQAQSALRSLCPKHSG